jgi:PAS domain S-box-containing protein
VTGFTSEETLGRACLDFMHPEDHGRSREAFLGVAAGTADSCRFELRFLTKNDGFRWVEVFGKTVLNSEGRIVGVYGTLSDIHDRKQAEEQRRALEQTEKLRRADGEAERLDVASILHEVAGLTAPRWRDGTQAEGRPIEVRVDVGPGLFICGRSADLREALTNLVFNAVDAMPGGGTISLAARQDGERVVVTVTDSGIGMSAEIQTRIFEPFFSTKGERGTGLGLAQLFGIVEQHDAEIAVDSTPGRGTAFRLTFAAASPAALPLDTRTRKPETETRPHLRILAVDDEPAMGSMLRRLLRPDGHTVVAVTAAEEALQRLETEPFDVVISDVGMGRGMNGWELATEVHRRQPELPFVLATGWGATIDPTEARTKGIHAVLAKPYPPAALHTILGQLPTPKV